MVRSHDAAAVAGIYSRIAPKQRRCGKTRRLGRILSTALSILLICSTTTAPAGIVRTGLFGTTEIPSFSLKKFPKWRGTLARFADELNSCERTHCRIGEWNQLIASLRGWDVPTQLALLNAYVNRYPYVEDRVNWRQVDYWATPLQFLARSGGDCEDFAITKYLVLRELGTDVDDMRIVIVRDRARGIAHAVLAVYVDGEALILDNQRDDVVVADLIRNYVPVYSLNERGWWLHRR
jgi:predicted transglutaminase-like cysteine proteinase